MKEYNEIIKLIVQQKLINDSVNESESTSSTTRSCGPQAGQRHTLKKPRAT